MGSGSSTNAHEGDYNNAVQSGKIDASASTKARLANGGSKSVSSQSDNSVVFQGVAPEPKSVSFKQIPADEVEKKMTVSYRKKIDALQVQKESSKNRHLLPYEQDLILTVRNSTKLRHMSDEEAVESTKGFSGGDVSVLQSVKKQELKESSVKAKPPQSSDLAFDYSPELYGQTEKFCDSLFIRSFLTHSEADELMNHLIHFGSKPHATMSKTKTKYPIFSKSFGLRRARDGARAVDRWGSYHESWLRVQEPTKQLKALRAKLIRHFNLSEQALNTMVVHYNNNGDTNFIPAHKDTTASLDENGAMFRVFLGGERKFTICSMDDVGKNIRSTMDISKEWDTLNGDLLAYGRCTNDNYCNSVPRQAGKRDVNVSIVFRTVTKSFIHVSEDTVFRSMGLSKEQRRGKKELSEMQLAAITGAEYGDTYPRTLIPEIMARYRDGREVPYSAIVLATETYGGQGKEQHIADMITSRELGGEMTEILLNRTRSSGENTPASVSLRSSFAAAAKEGDLRDVVSARHHTKGELPPRSRSSFSNTNTACGSMVEALKAVKESEEIEKAEVDNGWGRGSVKAVSNNNAFRSHEKDLMLTIMGSFKADVVVKKENENNNTNADDDNIGFGSEEEKEKRSDLNDEKYIPKDAISISSAKHPSYRPTFVTAPPDSAKLAANGWGTDDATVKSVVANEELHDYEKDLIFTVMNSMKVDPRVMVEDSKHLTAAPSTPYTANNSTKNSSAFVASRSGVHTEQVEDQNGCVKDSAVKAVPVQENGVVRDHEKTSSSKVENTPNREHFETSSHKNGDDTSTVPVHHATRSFSEHKVPGAYTDGLKDDGSVILGDEDEPVTLTETDLRMREKAEAAERRAEYNFFVGGGSAKNAVAGGSGAASQKYGSSAKSGKPSDRDNYFSFKNDTSFSARRAVGELAPTAYEQEMSARNTGVGCSIKNRNRDLSRGAGSRGKSYGGASADAILSCYYMGKGVAVPDV